MAKHTFNGASIENDSPIVRGKKRKSNQPPLRNKAEAKIRHAMREIAQANQVIADAQAAVARYAEEVRSLQQTLGDDDPILRDARRLLTVARKRLETAVMSKNEALQVIRQRRSKIRKQGR